MKRTHVSALLENEGPRGQRMASEAPTHLPGRPTGLDGGPRLLGVNTGRVLRNSKFFSNFVWLQLPVLLKQ